MRLPLTMFAASLLCSAAFAQTASTDTSYIDAQQTKLQQEITSGITAGTLSPNQAQYLQDQLQSITDQESSYKAGNSGGITSTQREQLDRAIQNAQAGVSGSSGSAANARLNNGVGVNNGVTGRGTGFGSGVSGRVASTNPNSTNIPYNTTVPDPLTYNNLGPGAFHPLGQDATDTGRAILNNSLANTQAYNPSQPNSPTATIPTYPPPPQYIVPSTGGVPTQTYPYPSGGVAQPLGASGGVYNYQTGIGRNR